MAKTKTKRIAAANSPPGALRDRVYDLLRKALREGEIRPNQHLGEHSLARQLRVSRTPVREALALLMREGLLVSTTKGLTLPQLSIDDIRQIYQIRKLLEPGAMQETARHATQEQIAGLRAAVKGEGQLSPASSPPALFARSARMRGSLAAQECAGLGALCVEPESQTKGVSHALAHRPL